MSPKFCNRYVETVEFVAPESTRAGTQCAAFKLRLAKSIGPELTKACRVTPFALSFFLFSCNLISLRISLVDNSNPVGSISGIELSQFNKLSTQAL